jgi:hypothetical protein
LVAASWPLQVAGELEAEQASVLRVQAQDGAPRTAALEHYVSDVGDQARLPCLWRVL